jgi:hypothetical protein
MRKIHSISLKKKGNLLLMLNIFFFLLEQIEQMRQFNEIEKKKGRITDIRKISSRYPDEDKKDYNKRHIYKYTV